MSEEEKAIEYIKEFKNEVFEGVGNKSIMAKNIDILLNLLDKQKEEIKEKSTIILAGAEKVKQLEKEIEALEIIHNTYKEMIEENNYISKDKIKERIDKYRKKIEKLHSQELWYEPEDTIKDFKYNHYLKAYKELLEDK